MAVTGSPFCEHKKLRTNCAECKASAVPAVDPGMRAAPYTATYERVEQSERKAAAPREAKAKPTGPGKPLMPARRSKQKVTAADEAKAVAWWVKDGKAS